jgi:hypothetical protein
MDCLLPLVFGVCLAEPSTLTLKADAHYQVSHQNFYQMDGRPYDGAIGRVELRVDSREYRGFRLTYFAGHLSFIDTNRDRGYEYVGAGLEWRPFR